MIMNAAFDLIRNNTKVLKLSVISLTLLNQLRNGENKNKVIWHDYYGFHTATNFLIKHIKMSNGDNEVET